MGHMKPDKRVMREFSERFTDLADKHDPDLSNKELGKVFGVSDTSVFKWKKAESMPKIANAALIAIRYNVSIDWLLTGRSHQSESDINVEAALNGLSKENRQRILDIVRSIQALD